MGAYILWMIYMTFAVFSLVFAIAGLREGR